MTTATTTAPTSDPSIAESLRERSEREREETHRSALERYRTLLNDSIDRPFAAETLDELAGLLTALALPPETADADLKLIRHDRRLQAAVVEAGPPAEEALKKLPGLKQKELEAASAHSAAMAARSEAERIITARKSLAAKARQRRAENPRLWS